MEKFNESYYSKLINLAIRGLEPLYDDHQKLFTHKIAQKQLTPEDFHSSITYTAITILGLIRARKNGWGDISINETEALHALVNRINEVPRPGDLGLILWADSHSEGKHTNIIYKAIKDETHDNKLRQLPTFELAWLLTGLCYAHNNVKNDAEYKNLILKLYKAITNNLNTDSGLFGYRHACNWPATIRNNIGNFADQIYSVYALSTYYDIFKQSEAINHAIRCTNRLCELQGSQGQWWWHYQSQKDIIASGYPVYAVHQDGMAPMTLFKLSALSGKDFQPAIQRGINWLRGDNELGIEITDWNKGIIWRDIEWKQPRASLKYVSMATGSLGLKRSSRLLNQIPSYKLNYEMRSYHLGWVLYAFANKYLPQENKV